MKVSIHQPNYVPWLGYFLKIAQSDVFVFLDDAQYSNEGMHNYHYIKTPQGPLRLKIPVEYHFGDEICHVKTKDELKWKEKHLQLIESNYKKAPFFKEVFEDFSNLLNQRFDNMAQMNIEIIRLFSEKLNIKTRFIKSSELSITSQREEKVITICEHLSATEYISGTGAKSYQNEENFLNRGIKLTYLNYHPLEYRQLWGDFHANVSMLDYLMNCGYDFEPIIAFQKNYE
jgi:hypothetical protein